MQYINIEVGLNIYLCWKKIDYHTLYVAVKYPHIVPCQLLLPRLAGMWRHSSLTTNYQHAQVCTIEPLFFKMGSRVDI